ncbi:MAG: YtxH domain-containing protein [Syntrophales bacterium]|nr:YtxH domain-containing protein [Syntrophales bacterium]
MSEKVGDFIKGLLIGGVAGIILGILYAPKSGKETREELGRKSEELLAKAKEDYERALEKSKKTYESAIKRLGELESAAKKKFEHVDEDVSELVEQGKEVLQDGKSRLKRALDAGVEAFKEEKTS